MKFIDKHILEIAFVISSFAVVASLVLSNILGYIPCELCWYQRIVMFPLPVIFGVSILRDNQKIYAYTMPFILVGLFISLYQNLLIWGVVSETAESCSLSSISCGEPQINLLGFLTIPFGAMLVFGGLTALMFREMQLQNFKSSFKPHKQELFVKLLVFVGAVSLIGIALTKILSD